MQKRFELWLDESGDFKNQAELQKRHMKPALIGGVLLEKHNAQKVDLESLIDDNKNHANRFSDQEKREYVLPILETLKKQYGAWQVFFENQTYSDEKTNRQLYLKIMAEGLLQLLQTLNATWESVLVEVVIAQRQDMEISDSEERKIKDEEYVTALKTTMKRKQRLRRLSINADSELKFTIIQAHREKKLQTADFVCNTRLTRDSNAFAQCEERLEKLYENAYVFSLAEVGTDNYIKQSLTQGNISDAIMELYTSLDKKINREVLLEMILQRMQHENYRVLKAQLKQCSGDIVVYASMQDDYEVAEELFINILSELIEKMKERQIPRAHFEFTLLLWLSDNYLREGDIIAARKCIERCREVQSTFGNALEEVFTYYQVIEKESLLLIDEFNFEAGKNLMHKTGTTFIKMLQFFEEDDNTNSRFQEMRSEYFGDVLCMEIYAGIFLQKHNPQMYEELCELSELAMKQYPTHEGELERHRQYRSRIESLHGDYETALKYLFLAKEYHADSIDKTSIRTFVDKICDSEQIISCQYYLMYYLLIMIESFEGGNQTLAQMMYDVLIQQERLMQYGNLRIAGSSEMKKVDTKDVADKASGVVYHPLEIIAWKYATYMYHAEKFEVADMYYTKALAICFTHSNYTTLRITGLGIWAEKIACLLKNKKSNAAKQDYEKLRQEINSLKKQELQTETMNFVKKIETALKSAKNEKGELDALKLLEVSHKITY